MSVNLFVKVTICCDGLSVEVGVEHAISYCYWNSANQLATLFINFSYKIS